MRRATEADLPAIRACLSERPDCAMFPLGNLARFGFEGEADYAPFFWIAEEGGRVTDVLTISRAGMVMPFLPSGDFAAARAVLSGRTIAGFIGPAAESRPLIDGAEIGQAATALDRDEPHYALDLARMVVPDGPGHLVPLDRIDLSLFVAWRAAYHVEALGDPPERAAEGAEAEIAGYAAADSHRALIVDGEPVAMTGFNARLPKIVQIGGVYTPPDLRGRGHARRAVALHLAEARAEGVLRATLFSGSPAASRAYEAIGFRRIGDWTMCLLRDPVTVDG